MFMLKAVLTKEAFGALDDATKGLYAESDGLYLLQVEAVTVKVGDANKTFALEDTTGLRSALSKERSNVEALTSRVKKFESLTEEPQVYLNAVAKVKEFGDFKDADAKAKAQLDAHKATMEATYAAENKKLRDENETLSRAKDSAIRAHAESMRDGEARRAFAHHKVLPDWQDVMLDKVRAVTRVKTNDDGTFSCEVVDADGMVRLTNKTGSTERMNILELVETFKGSPALAPCFEATNAQGSGATGSSSNNRGGIRPDFTKMTGPQKMEWARTHKQ
jgi:hypothetical protein